jgi:regulator of protease activity HflC (stomatin/prohibitin superfamily)
MRTSLSAAGGTPRERTSSEASIMKFQQHMTIHSNRDKAALRVNAWAQCKVVNIQWALLENKEYYKQLYVAFQPALREYVAEYNFDELLDKKESIVPFVLDNVRAKAEVLGVEVNAFGIRDIILPGDVKEIMNQVLGAEKKAQANTIMRREETASTGSLLNTAKLMEDNAMLWKWNTWKRSQIRSAASVLEVTESC